MIGMTARHLVIAAALAGVGLVLVASPAAAQSTTTGAIQGHVVDADTGENLVGVTVVVTSPVLQSTQTVVSDESGGFKIAELPPGTYLVTFYINQLTLQRPDVNVGLDRTTPVFQKIKLSQATGEVVKITDTAPTIDPTSTTQGITIDKNYLHNIPVPGRTFDTALGAAAGSQGDIAGIGFSGSSSLENQYFVDGVNTTGLTFGTVGTPVINDFIEEIEVVTGGYNAEYGRATGGVVNVVTKTGSNEFKGSIFGTIQPGLLTASAQTTPINASSIDATANNAYIADLGFELGGPIIKDRLWFFVGFAPQVSRTDLTRTTKRETDCRHLLPSGQLSACDPRTPAMGGLADGIPDVDPKTGFFITDTLDQEVRSDTVQIYNFLGKLNFAANPENQVQLSLQALPRFATNPGIFGLEDTGFKAQELTTDLGLKWTSKLNDGRTEIEAVAGWHRDHLATEAMDPMVASQPLQILTNGNLGTWGPGFGGETAATNAGCSDNPMGGDPYPLITNCPMIARAYTVGGPGPMVNDTEQRLSAAAAVTERVKLLGNHEIKAGVDVDSDTADKARLYSGGGFLQNFVGSDIILTRWVQLRGLEGSPQAMNNTDPRFDNMCSTPNTGGGSAVGTSMVTFLCDYLGGNQGDPGTQVTSNTLNWSAYLRDSWQIRPNLTLNAGVRYEEQRLRYASFLQHTTDPLTDVPLGKNAMTLQNMWAPRIGAIYDWTQEGRSKVYAHWGRFYESIPLDINARSFGGEVQLVQHFAQCGAFDPRFGGSDGSNCLTNPGRVSQEQLVGASGVLIAPGIRPQYLDEIVIGAEYEVIDDLKVGLSYQNRQLGRVIEDVSPDGANTFIIANPGEWSSAEEQKLEAQIARTDDMATKARLQNELTLFQGIRIFDKPRRDYNAVQLTVTRRFSRQLYLQGSYTYSRVIGNYPGLIAADTGQIDPNISSQYDLIELLANRQGALPQDRPHYIKLDGYYTFDLRKQGALTVGARIRAFSGIPENALGSHYLYGPNESFLLPRGSLGRSDFEHGIDLHVDYTRDIGRGMALSVFADVFNLYDYQGSATVDSTYAPSVTLRGQVQNANPISGGSYEDLIWLKQIDAKGNETSTPIARNPNFGNTISRYAPAFGRLGARLTF
jgi:outer membrane receptor protein involved in Fe transport